MKNYKTEGIIIKRKNYREADRILTVFTKKNGKIKVKANGVRKINSRRSPHIELLNHDILSLYNGKTFPILTEVEVIDDFSDIKKDLIKIGFVYHLCELIDGLCPENQENIQVFNLFKNTLSRISLEENIVFIVHEFEISLLTNLGFYRNTSNFKKDDLSELIENILERKLKTRQILHHFME